MALKKGPAHEAGFNTPFKGLKAKLAKDEKTPEKAPKEAPGASSPPPPVQAGPHPSAPRSAGFSPLGCSDDALFLQAMSGTRPLARDPRGQAPPPAPRPAPPIVSDDAETLARLAELVSGAGPLDISDTDEFIQGAAPGVNGQLMLALKRGDYSLQGHLDLHGKTRAEAKEAVIRFLAESRRQGHRCVLLVHGRGINSKDQIPVLKEQLNVWLRHGSLARSVLAFCTARPHDGGAGALYVLLRK